jgi:hypothetical protein
MHKKNLFEGKMEILYNHNQLVGELWLWGVSLGPNWGEEKGSSS